MEDSDEYKFDDDTPTLSVDELNESRILLRSKGSKSVIREYRRFAEDDFKSNLCTFVVKEE